MSFSQKYEELERKFCEQVQKDFDCHGLESGMLRNIQPDGPADFILIAQEPAKREHPLTGKRPSDWERIKHNENRNFCGHIYDFMFHFCVRNYLCKKDQTYYLTDLSKGAMSVKQASDTSPKTYKRWYPLLLEELDLMAKPGQTQIIAIGRKVQAFLTRSDKCGKFEGIDWVAHYSQNALPYRIRAIKPHLCEFEEGFRQTLDFNCILKTTENVLVRAGYSEKSRQKKRQELCKGSRLTTARKKSIFYYKKRFEELKASNSKGLIWKGES